MKNIYNKIQILVVVLAAMALGSCTDKYSYEPETTYPEDAGQIYLSESFAGKVYCYKHKPVKLKLMRNSDVGVKSVNLEFSGKGVELIEVPGEATFSDGEKEVVIEFNHSIEPGQSAEIKVSVPEKDRFLYANSTAQVNLVCDYDWIEGEYQGAFGIGLLEKPYPIKYRTDGVGTYKFLDMFVPLKAAGCEIKDGENTNIFFEVLKDGTLEVKPQYAFTLDNYNIYLRVLKGKKTEYKGNPVLVYTVAYSVRGKDVNQPDKEWIPVFKGGS